MIHPTAIIKHINDSIGYGVFATEFIPEGTIVYVKDSLEIEISPQDYQSHSEIMQKAIEKYSYIDQRGYRIVSWDFAKYVNHCCHPNSISTGYGFEIAIRDISAGEEITDEYGIFNLERNMEVSCGKTECRKILKNEDFENYYQAWDLIIKKTLRKIDRVDQPLFPFIDSETVHVIQQFIKYNNTYKSVYALRNLQMLAHVNGQQK
ncbi:MAG: SET domain-containing protein [Bacteroidetes bacterium]|nr:SET domain-containing protein [Bacteroidota bacterium]